MVNLRDPKKWHYEATGLSSQATSSADQTGHVVDLLGRNRQNGSATFQSTGRTQTSDLIPGGDASPVRDVAADFVHSAVDMALNKVNNNAVSEQQQWNECFVDNYVDRAASKPVSPIALAPAYRRSGLVTRRDNIKSRV